MAVTAMVNRQEELDETPDGFVKLLIDAHNLDFEDSSFDNATLLY